jgi:hypothetical protein
MDPPAETYGTSVVIEKKGGKKIGWKVGEAPISLTLKGLRINILAVMLHNSSIIQLIRPVVSCQIAA